MEKIYHNYWEDLFDTTYKRVRDEEIAQDITQEIFISLWENREKLAIEGSLRAYLQGAVKFKIINYFKASIVKDKHKEDLRLLVGDEMELSAAHKLIMKDLNKEIDAAISALPEKMRQVFLMSRRQEKTIREISSELGLSVQTVKNQISAALKVLKERLSYLLFFMLVIFLI